MDEFVLCGVDVSAATFDIALQSKRAVVESKTYDNSIEGRRSFVQHLEVVARGRKVRVCLEATGVYSLDLSFLLFQTEGIEVMVVNPREMPKLREILGGRNKSDRQDAVVALEYLKRFDFEAWRAPAREVVELRQLARRIHDLMKLRTQEKNRLHASRAASELTELLEADLVEMVEHLDEKVKKLRERALKLITSQDELREKFDLLLTAPGVGKITGIGLLAEIAVMPKDMTVKQWVAWAGLDVISHDSGVSVHKPPRISRRGSALLRHVLFFPALTASSHDVHVKEFYQSVLGRRRKPMIALVAVMRKLLHAFFGMLKHKMPFDGARFRALPA
jgi:transposase